MVDEEKQYTPDERPTGAAQPRQGRARQIRRSMVRRQDPDEISRRPAPEGGKSYALARTRQMRTVKQARAATSSSDLAPVRKTAIARAVQPRQLAAMKAVRPARLTGAEALPVSKVAVARSAQRRQAAASRVERRSAT